MNAGAIIDAVSCRIFRVGGVLVAMVVKRKISRQGLLEVVAELDNITQDLKGILNGMS